MVTGLADGWLIVKWSTLFHNIGFTQIDPNKPMNWSEFLIKILEKDEFEKEQQKNKEQKKGF